jgi:nucleotide-binding universal stress UspA family protein
VNRILIAIDGSPAAAAAVQRGLELAAQEDAEVAFLHVLPGVSSEGEPASAGDSAVLREAAAKATAHGVRAGGELARGEAADVILSRSEALDVSLIVIGSRGRSGAVGALLGTVSSGVLHSAERPVLVVRSPARSPKAG